MKFLVTGSAGLLGRQLARDLSESCQVYSCYHRTRPDYGIPTPMDLSRPDQIEATISKTRPDVIFHCAAITDADACEREQDLASMINVKATETLARQAAKIKSFLVYISTDQVFDGKKGMKIESDTPGPVNHYGRTKLEGEKAVQEVSSKWLTGPGVSDSIFIPFFPSNTWSVDMYTRNDLILAACRARVSVALTFIIDARSCSLSHASASVIAAQWNITSGLVLDIVASI